MALISMNYYKQEDNTIYSGEVIDVESTQLAPHEAIEVREFISQEILGIKKINASLNMVNDQELKNFMQDSIASKKAALQNIQSALGFNTK